MTKHAKPMKILAINPGSTSTKIAVYNDQTPILELSLAHSAESLKGYPTVMAQFDFRKQAVLDALLQAGIDPAGLDAVIGRGGLVKPIPSGVYLVNDALRRDLLEGVSGEHASNLGGLIADSIARPAGIPAYIADPVVVDELQDVARVTGLPQVARVSIFHALNQKAVAREYAERIGKPYEELNLIVAHLGGGISVGAHRQGQVVDVNNALDGDGPFSPERSGSLPTGGLVSLCYDPDYNEQRIRKMLCGRGGLVAHLGTNNMKEAFALAQTDHRTKTVLDAMFYNIGKAIGSMAAVLAGKVDAIIITGGIAHNPPVCDYITKMVSFIAPVIVRPGENELEALATNAIHALEGSVPVKIYE